MPPKHLQPIGRPNWVNRIQDPVFKKRFLTLLKKLKLQKLKAWRLSVRNRMMRTRLNAISNVSQ
eukprot:6461231-Pyramimonas_sp.AAC.1